MNGYTTRQAAHILDVTPARLRYLAHVARKQGDEWLLPREEWPDGRTRLYRTTTIDALKENR